MYQPIEVPIRGRRLNQLTVQKRAFQLMYDHFDSLPAACREALREEHDWHRTTMIKCGAGECEHGGKNHHGGAGLS